MKIRIVRIKTLYIIYVNQKKNKLKGDTEMRKLTVKNTKGNNIKGGKYTVISKTETKTPIHHYGDEDGWCDDTVLGD